MDAYPDNDTQFTDYVIERVTTEDDGTHVIQCDGWSLWCRKDCPVVPAVGQTARHYGIALGGRVRGLFIDGVKVWYLTAAEDDEQFDIQMYGADAADWLARWDSGKGVWSIEMGGIGPGYEQCIQIVVAEALRWFLANKCNADLWKEPAVWQADRDAMTKAVQTLPVIDNLGLSGAQWGAGVSLASGLYMDGPRKIMNDPKLKDRKIQVGKNFPRAA